MQSQKNSRKKRAATLVEFALVFPMFVVVVMATCDLGRYMFIQSTMSHVTRTALRYGVTEQQQQAVVSGSTVTLSVRESILKAASSANPVPTLIPIKAGSATTSSTDTFLIDIAGPTTTAWSSTLSSTGSNSPWSTLSSSVSPVQISGQLLRITYTYKFTYVTPLIGFIRGGTNNTTNIKVQTIYQAETY